MTDLDTIRRAHGIRPKAQALAALRDAYEAGLRDARQPAGPSVSGRRRYGAGPGEAATLRLIRSMRGAGDTWQAIADALDRCDIRQRNGGMWTASSVAGVTRVL